MFYAYLRNLVAFLLWVFNGNAVYHHTEKILDPLENYILVAPHRSWLDPLYMGFGTSPKQFVFMAKKELFKNRMFGWWIKMCGAFPIDRENPGRQAIKYPINVLKYSDRSLLMFPSGSRHAEGVKGGVAVIAKMAKVKILPAVYSGPVDLKGMISGQQVDMSFGDAIDVSDIRRMNDEGIEEVARRIQSEFDRLDLENKERPRRKGPNLLLRIIKIPLGLLAILLLLLTVVFSYLASFVWDPDKHSTIKTAKDD